MFYSLTGKVVHTEPGFAVVECGGVGFQCHTTLGTLSRIQGETSPVTLYTYLNVREDALVLFGFADPEELHCFKMLISVNGVGPKMALALLSSLSVGQFAVCVANQDSKSLTRAPGVGPKIAQRIVLELKDKLSVKDKAGVELPMGGVPSASSNAQEAVDALAALGFSPAEASSAVGRLDSALPVETLVREALKTLGKR